MKIYVILCIYLEIAASHYLALDKVLSPAITILMKDFAKWGMEYAKEQMNKEKISTCPNDNQLIQDFDANIRFMCDDDATYMYEQLEAMKSKKFQGYDIAINPKGRTLKAIGNQGWKYTINNRRRFKQLASDKKFKAFFVCILGEFNQGKTWLINLLSDRWFEFGFDQVTKSIGCALPVTNSHIVYCDSPGTSRAVHIDDLNDRVGTDRIIEETMIAFSDMLLLICGPLTTTEQVRHRKYIDRISELEGSRKRVVYIVHNWKSFYTLNQVKHFIQSDIIDAYGAEKRELNNSTFYFHIDNRTGLGIKHVIFAAEGSRAGMYWNSKSLEMMKSVIEDYGQTNAMHTFKVVREFKKELEPLLRETFTTRDNEEVSISRNESYSDIYWNMVKAPVRYVTSFGKSLWSVVDDLNPWKQTRLQDDFPQLSSSSDLDPYELVVHSDNKTLVMKNAHSLEYFESSEIGGKPVPFYRARLGIFQSNNTWEIQIWIPGCDWWNASQFSGIMVRREGTKLIVEGNILKPDRVKEQDNGEYLFDILTETRRFGYFRMPFELPACVHLDQCMKNDKIGWYDADDNPHCAWKKSLQAGMLIITASADCKIPKIARL